MGTRANGRIDWGERIRIANAMFDAMNPQERRMWLAMEVLRQLRKGQIRTSREYESFFLETLTSHSSPPKGQLMEVLGNEVCTVCALGALAVAAAKSFDKVQAKDVYVAAPSSTKTFNNFERGIYPIIKDYFSVDQIVLIENAFECGNGYLRPGSTLAGERVANIIHDHGLDIHAARVFAIEANRTRRLQLIMENIIMGDGKFDPERAPELEPLPSTKYYTPGFDPAWLHFDWED